MTRKTPWTARKLLSSLFIALSLLVLIGGQQAMAITQNDIDCQADQTCFYDPTVTACDSSDTATTVSFKGSKNEKNVFDFFLSKGFQPYQAAGIVGNMAAEDGSFDPTLVEGGGHSNDPSNISAGYGIVQWTPGSGLLNFMKEAGISTPPNTLDTQVNTLWYELQHSYTQVVKDVMNATDIRDATDAFMGSKTGIGGDGKYDGFEKPKYQDATQLNTRTAAARSVLARYGNDAPASDLSTAVDADSSTCCPPASSSDPSGDSTETGDTAPADWDQLYKNANDKALAAQMSHGKMTGGVKILAIHYTVGEQSGEDLLKFFANNSEGTGIQFNVGQDGTIYQYYPLNDMQITWHIVNANSHAIGIEITGKDVTELLNDQKQFDSVVSLAKYLCNFYNIPCSQPKGDITGDNVDNAQGMLGHDEVPDNDHNDPDAKYNQTEERTDSSQHEYMVKLRTALGFNPTPGQGKGTTTQGVDSASTTQCPDASDADTETGNGTKNNPVGDGPNKDLALEAIKYDTKATGGKYYYVWGGLHGATSELQAFENGGGTDCAGFVRYIIWKVYGHDVGSFVTQNVPSMTSMFQKIPANEVKAGDIGWRSDHVEFITDNEGQGKWFEFGAHDTQDDLYGGPTSPSAYQAYYRYIGPKGSGN